MDEYKDTETKARVQGVASQMGKFDFFFGLTLGTCLMRHSDTLSSALQSKDLTASEGQRLAAMTVKTIQKMRTDEGFMSFWKRTTEAASEKGVAPAILPRKVRPPRRIEDCLGGHAEPEFPASPESYFKRIYFEAIDLTTNAITARFDQKDYKVYSLIESLLIKSVAGEESNSELEQVVRFFKPDFSLEDLRFQLQILQANYENSHTLSGLFEHFRAMSSAEKCLMYQVTKLVKLLMTVPASNASSERSFSALRRMKTYLRATMKQERLNHMMIAYVHKANMDALNMTEIANDFVQGNERRMGLFGHFS